MKKIFLTIGFVFSSASQAQISLSEPINLSGYEDGIRTVHFTENNQYVVGDYNDIVAWRISDQSLAFKVAIPGYNVNQSMWDPNQIKWLQGNSNYNSAKNDITDMHTNLNIWNGEVLQPGRTDNSYMVGSFIPGTDAVVIGFTDANYQDGVVRLNTITREETTHYYSAVKHGEGAVYSIDVSPEGKYVAISVAGENSAIWIFDILTGEVIATFATEADAYGVAFSGNGASVSVVSGNDLIMLSTLNWQEMKRINLQYGPSTVVDVSHKGSWAIAGGLNGAVLIDINEGRVVSTLSEARIFDVTISPGDDYAALGLQKTLHVADNPSVILYKNLNPQY